jgi:plastocyanin
MARIALVTAAASGAAALAASATSGAVGVSGGAAANSAPVASLRAKHRRPRVGQEVVLDSSRSRDRDGRIVHHLWDFGDDGIYEKDSGRRARIRHAFHRPGKVRVAVMVVDDEGGHAVRRARFRVVARGAERSHALRGAKRAKKRRHHRRVRAATLSEKHAQTVELPKASPTTSTPSPRVHAAAASSGVTIVDFSFKPKSITVNVGDTVVWTNKDSVPHSATADDGTFDTGLLSKNVTGSYKFTTTGTFSYHCTPHDYMKASVTVTGSGGSSSPSSDSGNSGGSSGSNSSSNSSSLPHTGLQIATVVLAGLALLGAGAALRRRLSRP